MIRIKGGRLVFDSIKRRQEKVRIIKATTPTKECISGIQTMGQEWLGENLVELTVLAKESDQVLNMLLKQGCSILELSEKR